MFDLTTTFDESERVTQISLTSSGQALKLFDYDDPAGTSYPQCAGSLCNGKIAATARWNNTDLGALWVTEGYSYDDLTGLPLRRDTSVGSTSSFAGDDFATSQTYDAFGSPEFLYYPCRKDAAGACRSGDPAQRVVTRTYQNGFASAVSPGATSITYAGDGTIDTIRHPGSVNETLVGDPSGMPRPCGIFVYGSGVSLITDTTAPCGKRLSGSGTQWSAAPYSYDGAGNIKQIGTATYAYDAMQRLVSWSNTPSGSGTRSYDNWGNYLGAGSIRTTTNHYSLWTYDEAGNVTNDNKGTYAYDAFNMMTKSTISTRDFRHLYTADDERIAVVEKVVVNTVPRTKTTWTLRGMGPELQREYFDDWSSGSRVFTLKEDEVWGAGLLLASITPTTSRYYGIDHLGSPRYVTSSTGAALGTQNFTPFGTGGTSTGGALQFTAQERDQANVGTGTADMPDYFHARFYRGDSGRFLSVDPGRDWDLRRPQSWNMYAYVRNNPINTIDPTGKWDWSDFKQWARDTREGISNWWQEKWHKDIPPPPDQYGGVEALEAADLSPEDAQQMGNSQANWANARAGAGAIISDQATEEVMTWGVGKVVGVAGVVVFGHGARHLIGTALEKEAVEAAIEKEVQFVSKEASQTGSFWGRVTVNGQVIEYRAHTLPNGTINVGTYFTPKP